MRAGVGTLSLSSLFVSSYSNYIFCLAPFHFKYQLIRILPPKCFVCLLKAGGKEKGACNTTATAPSLSSLFGNQMEHYVIEGEEIS